jgi:hypothetical protein
LGSQFFIHSRSHGLFCGSGHPKQVPGKDKGGPDECKQDFASNCTLKRYVGCFSNSFSDIDYCFVSSAKNVTYIFNLFVTADFLEHVGSPDS